MVWSVNAWLDPAVCGFLNPWLATFAILSSGHAVGSLYYSFHMAQDLQSQWEADYPLILYPQNFDFWEAVRDWWHGNRKQALPRRLPPPSTAFSEERCNEALCRRGLGPAFYWLIFFVWVAWTPLFQLIAPLICGRHCWLERVPVVSFIQILTSN